jgi:hypothetical protein
MKSTELRLGNWVNDDVNHDCKITLSDFYNMYLDDDCPFTAIPLTEEWLIKFNINFDVKLHDGKYYYYIWGEPNGTTLIEVPYVHTLQNLYFAITGKELTQ